MGPDRFRRLSTCAGESYEPCPRSAKSSLSLPSRSARVVLAMARASTILSTSETTSKTLMGAP